MTKIPPALRPFMLAAALAALPGGPALALDLSPARAVLEPAFPWTRVDRLDAATGPRGETWIAATLSSDGRAARFVVARLVPGGAADVRLDVEPPDSGDLRRVDAPLLRTFGNVIVAAWRERRACSSCRLSETGSHVVTVSADGGRSFSPPAEISPLGGRHLFRAGLDVRVTEGNLLALSIVVADDGSRTVELTRAPLAHPGRGEELVLESDSARIGDGDLSPTRLAAGEAGLVVAAWSGYDGRSSDVRVRVSPDGGRTFAGAVTVSDVAGTSDSFDLALEGGSLLVAWADSREAAAGKPDVDIRLRRGSVRVRDGATTLQWLAPVVVTTDLPGTSVDFAPRILRFGSRLAVAHFSSDPRAVAGAVGAKLASSEDSGVRWGAPADLSAPLAEAGFALYGGASGSFRALASPAGLRLLYLGDGGAGSVAAFEAHDSAVERGGERTSH